MIKKALPDVVDIYGSMDYDLLEQKVIDFSNGRTKLFATKKSLSGSGCNFQRYCHREIFLGIDYRVEWRAVGGNPACRGYDNFISRHNGTKHILRDAIRDADGNYRDDIIYEIVRGGGVDA